MTGRGIDQVLPHPCDPRLFEGYMTSALGYVELAERANGPVPKPVAFAYPWGAALDVLERYRPDLRIINLETSVTGSNDALPKGINYRMSPENLPCISAAGIDCCSLANNHVLDWGEAGLLETLETLHKAGIVTTGAGRDEDEARRPAVLDVRGRGRVLIYACGCDGSGVPAGWAAGRAKPGVGYLPDLSPDTAIRLAERIRREKQPGDRVVFSIHWGGNWGYDIPAEQRRFAHALIDAGGADIVYGHSSHHPRAIEVYRERLILYGCGDFINDYEGIGGHEAYRGDLVLMYLPALHSADGTLARLRLVPFRLRNLRLHHVSAQDYDWLGGVLARQCRSLGTRFRDAGDGTLLLDRS